MKDTTGRHIRKKWLAAAACVAVFAAVLLVRISAGPGKAAEAEAASPQDVLSGFYSALISGQTDMLAEYCDTTASVMEYVENFISGTADMRGKEPGAFSIAAGMVTAGTEERRKDRDGILNAYRSSLSPAEFYEQMNLLGEYCAFGTEDIPRDAAKAERWRQAAV